MSHTVPPYVVYVVTFINNFYQILTLPHWVTCACCSYIVSLGILDKLSEYLTNVQGPIDDSTSAVEFIEHAVSLVTAVVRVTSRRW